MKFLPCKIITSGARNVCVMVSFDTLCGGRRDMLLSFPSPLTECTETGINTEDWVYNDRMAELRACPAGRSFLALVG